MPREVMWSNQTRRSSPSERAVKATVSPLGLGRRSRTPDDRGRPRAVEVVEDHVDQRRGLAAGSPAVAGAQQGVLDERAGPRRNVRLRFRTLDTVAVERPLLRRDTGRSSPADQIGLPAPAWGATAQRSPVRGNGAPVPRCPSERPSGLQSSSLNMIAVHFDHVAKAPRRPGTSGGLADDHGPPDAGTANPAGPARARQWWGCSLARTHLGS